MAQTNISFTDVSLTYMKDDTGKTAELHKPQKVNVNVKRMSEQAEIAVINPTEKTTIVKCNLSADQEMCRVSSTSYLIYVHADESILLKFTSSEELNRFRNLVDFRPLAKSVFDKRTEESSAVQYFQFYGYLSQQQNMMQDYVRTGTYQRAMLQNFINFQNKVVLDVGAGSGILSFFAMQAGARKVYAVEASTMAEYTKKLVNRSQYAGRIVVIPGKIEEISLPEKVDVIISEPMGYMLFNERMLETYIHAKKFLRQPNGMMFPTVGDLHVAPFSDEQLYMEQFTKANFWYQQSFHGIDLSHLRDDAVEEYFRQPIVDTFDVRILMAKSVKYTVNFLTAEEEDLHRIEIPLRFTAHTSGTVHGFAFWFDIAFIGTISTVWLSTSPTEPLTHWYQVRCLLRNPLFVKAGEVLLGKVVLRSNKRQSYDIDIEALVEATGCKSENTLDLKNPFFHYTGQVPSAPPGTNNTSPSDPFSSGVNVSSSGNYENSQQQQLANQQINQNHGNISAQGNNMCYQNMDGQTNNHNGAHCNVVPMLNGGSIPHPGTLGNTNNGGKTSLTRTNHNGAIPDQYTSASTQHSYY